MFGIVEQRLDWSNDRGEGGILRGNVAIMARLLYNAGHVLRSREVAGMPLQIDIPHDEIAAFCQRWRIRELAIFGSALRDDFRPDSDVDVSASPGR